MFKLSVLVSGSGTTLDNLAHHCFDENEGMLFGWVKITNVIADRECEAREIAKKWNLPFLVVPRRIYRDTETWSEALLASDVHLHIMGGFLSKIVVPEKWHNRVLNIHPSMLPLHGGKGMYGLNVHKAVIESKDKSTGCSVHVVDNEYDHGPIIGQMKVAILPWDTPETLQEAVQSMERMLYPRAILNYLKTSKTK